MSQKYLVLRLLREAGSEGVSAHELIYDHGVTRMAAYVFDLRGEGWDIETIDDGDLEDGRRKLARYVLHEKLPSWPRYTPSQIGYAAREAIPLPFSCGCIRAADGRSWEQRCNLHNVAQQPTRQETLPF